MQPPIKGSKKSPVAVHALLIAIYKLWVSEIYNHFYIRTLNNQSSFNNPIFE